MSLLRRIAGLFLAAGLSAGVLAQQTVPVDDEAIFVAVEAAVNQQGFPTR